MAKEELILQTADVKARVLTLLPGEVGPVHHHTEVTDHMFGVSGEVEVVMKNPDDRIILTPGKRCRVEIGRIHQVRNLLADETSQYLLIQGVGSYDFITK